MSALTDFFLGSNKSAVQLETLEITHPSFTKPYYIVRNARKGVTAKREDGSSTVFDYVPMKITNTGARDDMDTGVQVSFGDLGQILPKELDNIDRDDSYRVTPLVIYRSYSSEDLDNILVGPFKFEIKTLSQDQSGATFEAAAPGLNYSKTGEFYRVDRFPMLRGFL